MTIGIEDLTFGVELEVIMPRTNSNETGRSNLARSMIEAGLAAQHEHYNHQNRPHWKITTDASIGYDNAEIVSPILHGEPGFDNLRRAVTIIDQFGCRVNRTTGLHVHVGVRDRFAQRVGFFKELVRTYAKFEPVLDSIVAPSRREDRNSFCAPVRWSDRLEQATTVDDLRRAYGGNRFVKLNLEAFSAHGTVEFRQHQGTTNAQKVENWVKLCLRMVAHAAKNTKESQAGATIQSARLSSRSAPISVEGRDLMRATAIPASRLTRGEGRYYSRSWVIARVNSWNPRRQGSRGYDNWQNYRVGISIRQYITSGGGWDHLRWDVEHRNVVVVDLTTAPPLVTDDQEPTAPAVELPRPSIERPNTDLAPTTLDGLLDLIEASEAERTYFIERQMELNG